MIRFTTNKGVFDVELNEAAAPKTCENFLQYVRSGFYNGTIFHRVISGFMIQGGGFEPGLKQKQTKAPIENEANNGLKNDKYTIAMARTNDPHSATSQFFINVADNTNGVYLNVVQRFCYLDIVVTFDGSTRYTLTYNVYYPFLGQTVTLDAGEYGEFEYTFTKDDALFNHITHSITAEDGKTLADIIDPATVNVRIGYEKSAYIVTGTEDCTMHEPEAAE